MKCSLDSVNFDGLDVKFHVYPPLGIDGMSIKATRNKLHEASC